MIPKIIHFCWFGRNPKPDLTIKCYNSWIKVCPDYQFIEWNEDNYDLSSAPRYVQEAYAAKKWAFVSDYVRLHVVYQYGGIYLDTDVELLKNLDKFIAYDAFFGFESNEYVNTGLGFGAIAKCSLLKEMMDEYETTSFITADGSYDTTSCPIRNTEVLLRHGLRQNNCLQFLAPNIVILPSDFMCPIDIFTGIQNLTENTFSIHHFSASWYDNASIKSRNRWQRKNRLKAARHTILY